MMMMMMVKPASESNSKYTTPEANATFLRPYEPVKMNLVSVTQLSLQHIFE